jgi:signal transduction histidine kinase
VVHEDLHDAGDASPARAQTTAEPAASVLSDAPGSNGQPGSSRDDSDGEIDRAAASEIDQTIADADQTLSDADQTSAESDEAQAEADQRVSNRDQAAADREAGGTRAEHTGAYERSRAERLAGTLARRATSEERLETGIARLEHSASRDASADLRDLVAAANDRASAQRDHASSEAEPATSAEGAAVEHLAAARARVAADRIRAATDRERAAADRTAAARDRAAANTELRSARAGYADEVDQLAGGMAHNFNNLMAIVLGYASQAMRQAETPAGRRDLEEIITAADRAAALTGALLEYAGLSKSGRTPVDPSQAIRELESKLRELMAADIALDFQLDAHGAQLVVDAAEFDRIILNLALNARDAMTDGGMATFVTKSRTIRAQDANGDDVPAPGDYIDVSVSDTGEGIPAEILDRVFEPFFTTRGSQHPGLGLATVRHVVDAAGGWIDIDTEIDSGTTIRFTFPASAPHTGAVS